MSHFLKTLPKSFYRAVVSSRPVFVKTNSLFASISNNAQPRLPVVAVGRTHAKSICFGNPNEDRRKLFLRKYHLSARRKSKKSGKTSGKKIEGPGFSCKKDGDTIVCTIDCESLTCDKNAKPTKIECPNPKLKIIPKARRPPASPKEELKDITGTWISKKCMKFDFKCSAKPKKTKGCTPVKVDDRTPIPRKPPTPEVVRASSKDLIKKQSAPVEIPEGPKLKPCTPCSKKPSKKAAKKSAKPPPQTDDCEKTNKPEETCNQPKNNICQKEEPPKEKQPESPKPRDCEPLKAPKLDGKLPKFKEPEKDIISGGKNFVQNVCDGIFPKEEESKKSKKKKSKKSKPKSSSATKTKKPKPVAKAKSAEGKVQEWPKLCPKKEEKKSKSSTSCKPAKEAPRPKSKKPKMPCTPSEPKKESICARFNKSESKICDSKAEEVKPKSDCAEKPKPVRDQKASEQKTKPTVCSKSNLKETKPIPKIKEDKKPPPKCQSTPNTRVLKQKPTFDEIQKTANSCSKTNVAKTPKEPEDIDSEQQLIAEICERASRSRCPSKEPKCLKSPDLIDELPDQSPIMQCIAMCRKRKKADAPQNGKGVPPRDKKPCSDDINVYKKVVPYKECKKKEAKKEEIKPFVPCKYEEIKPGIRNDDNNDKNSRIEEKVKSETACEQDQTVSKKQAADCVETVSKKENLEPKKEKTATKADKLACKQKIEAVSEQKSKIPKLQTKRKKEEAKEVVKKIEISVSGNKSLKPVSENEKSLLKKVVILRPKSKIKFQTSQKFGKLYFTTCAKKFIFSPSSDTINNRIAKRRKHTDSDNKDEEEKPKLTKSCPKFKNICPDVCDEKKEEIKPFIPCKYEQIKPGIRKPENNEKQAIEAIVLIYPCDEKDKCPKEEEKFEDCEENPAKLSTTASETEKFEDCQSEIYVESEEVMFCKYEDIKDKVLEKITKSKEDLCKNEQNLKDAKNEEAIPKPIENNLCDNKPKAKSCKYEEIKDEVLEKITKSKKDSDSKKCYCPRLDKSSCKKKEEIKTFAPCKYEKIKSGIRKPENITICKNEETQIKKEEPKKTCPKFKYTCPDESGKPSNLCDKERENLLKSSTTSIVLIPYKPPENKETDKILTVLNEMKKDLKECKTEKSCEKIPPPKLDAKLPMVQDQPKSVVDGSFGFLRSILNALFGSPQKTPKKSKSVESVKKKAPPKDCKPCRSAAAMRKNSKTKPKTATNKIEDKISTKKEPQSMKKSEEPKKKICQKSNTKLEPQKLNVSKKDYSKYVRPNPPCCYTKIHSKKITKEKPVIKHLVTCLDKTTCSHHNENCFEKSKSDPAIYKTKSKKKLNKSKSYTSKKKKIETVKIDICPKPKIKPDQSPIMQCIEETKNLKSGKCPTKNRPRVFKPKHVEKVEEKIEEKSKKAVEDKIGKIIDEKICPDEFKPPTRKIDPKLIYPCKEEKIRREMTISVCENREKEVKSLAPRKCETIKPDIRKSNVRKEEIKDYCKCEEKDNTDQNIVKPDPRKCPKFEFRVKECRPCTSRKKKSKTSIEKSKKSICCCPEKKEVKITSICCCPEKTVKKETEKKETEKTKKSLCCCPEKNTEKDLEKHEIQETKKTLCCCPEKSTKEESKKEQNEKPICGAEKTTKEESKKNEELSCPENEKKEEAKKEQNEILICDAEKKTKEENKKNEELSCPEKEKKEELKEKQNKENKDKIICWPEKTTNEELKKNEIEKKSNCCLDDEKNCAKKDKKDDKK